MAFATRNDRLTTPISGVGGMLKFGHQNINNTRPANMMPVTPVILDITMWRVRHTLNLVDVTHSGSYGGQNFAMVGRHWEAQVTLTWNSFVRSDSPNSIDDWSGFLENLLIGGPDVQFNVQVVFFLGDPLNYIDGNGDIRDSGKLAAPLALCSNIETINEARGKSVVQQTAALTGNSKLQGWVGKNHNLTTRVF